MHLGLCYVKNIIPLSSFELRQHQLLLFNTATLAVAINRVATTTQCFTKAQSLTTKLKLAKMNDSPTASYFNIFITGQIECMDFPLGPDAAEVFCRYEVVAGPDWELVSGVRAGISQSASNKSGSFKDKIAFNFPLEWTFKSTSPFGWPQLLISIYGKTRWGIETALGYCRVHVPMFGANSDQPISAPILIPKNSNMISEMASWITGRNPELKDPQTLLDNTKNKGLSVESYGEVILKLNTIARGTSRLGYDWG